MKTNIASERAKLGLSQEQLGKTLSVSRDVVSNWESGETVPRVDMLFRLADLFGCSIDYLFCRTNDRLVHSPTEIVGSTLNVT